MCSIWVVRSPGGQPEGSLGVPAVTTCRHCGAEWGGMHTSHCTSCHETFDGIASFDQHRNRGRCAEPGELSALALLPRAYRCWGLGSC
ncbi:hypothetical protein [Rhodococcus globerulus]|uniref:FDXHR family putative zinc-binding protein n=1 Tax=Rhodococcus globerulus TaxID=33008 RepID=UPI003AFAA624